MRILMLSIAVLLTAVGAYAQGTVSFANVGAGLNAPVFDVDGVTKLAGPAFQAQLYVGGNTSESTLIAVPGTTVFFSGGSGYFSAGIKTLPGFPGGSRPFFQVRAWEAAGGASYDAALAAGKKAGKSAVFKIGADLGDSILPIGRPATLLGLTSFSLVPEPSAIVFGAVGGAILLLLSRVSKSVCRLASF